MLRHGCCFSLFITISVSVALNAQHRPARITQQLPSLFSVRHFFIVDFHIAVTAVNAEPQNSNGTFAAASFFTRKKQRKQLLLFGQVVFTGGMENGIGERTRYFSECVTVIYLRPTPAIALARRCCYLTFSLSIQ